MACGINAQLDLAAPKKMCIASTFSVSLLPYLFINLQKFYLFYWLNGSIPSGFSSLILRQPVTKHRVTTLSAFIQAAATKYHKLNNL